MKNDIPVLYGTGIATRAMAEFIKLVSQRPLFAYAAKHNLGAQRVLEKCGFERIEEGDADLLFRLDVPSRR